MDKRGECYRCRYFDRYYTKETRHFQPTKCGFCCKVQTVVSSHGDCEHYEAKLYRYKKDVLLKGCLSDLLTEISELRSMLEAEHHEEDV